MDEFEFYLAVLKSLEEIGADYMVVGAYGASAYGLNRSTHDVDIIVDLDYAACDALAARFPPPRYYAAYADPDQMRDSLRLGIMFNIIDTSMGVKADLVPLSREPDYQRAFRNRVRMTVIDQKGNEFVIWCALAEDIIIGKLLAWQAGRSQKHPQDIYVVLNFMLAGLGPTTLDTDAITTRAARIGPETLSLWQELLSRAENNQSG
jgi:hypothetical protein